MGQACCRQMFGKLKRDRRPYRHNKAYEFAPKRTWKYKDANLLNTEELEEGGDEGKVLASRLDTLGPLSTPPHPHNQQLTQADGLEEPDPGPSQIRRAWRRSRHVLELHVKVKVASAIQERLNDEDLTSIRSGFLAFRDGAGSSSSNSDDEEEEGFMTTPIHISNSTCLETEVEVPIHISNSTCLETEVEVRVRSASNSSLQIGRFEVMMVADDGEAEVMSGTPKETSMLLPSNGCSTNNNGQGRLCNSTSEELA